MSTGARITKPGPTDNEWMVVTCTPDETSVGFEETEDEAVDAARVNCVPTVSVYVGQVTRQGEHRMRGSSKHIAVMVEVDPELRRALTKRGVTSRKAMAQLFRKLLDVQLVGLRRTENAQSPAPCARCHLHFSGPHRCSADHAADCDIRTSRDGWDAKCSCGHDDTEESDLLSAITPTGTRVAPPVIRCHAGQRCTNWPECEFCGPPRL